MRFWDNLKTAFNLADRVEEVEKTVSELEFEWGEIQEKLLTREERLRKRLSRELRANLDAAPEGQPSSPQLVAPEGHQAAKKDIARKFRESREG